MPAPLTTLRAPLALATSAALLLAACDPKPPAMAPSTAAQAVTSAGHDHAHGHDHPPEGAALKTAPAESAQDATADEVKQVGASTLGFAIGLNGHLDDKPGNLVTSPLSVSLALGMVQAGAGGETAMQLRQALGFELEEARLHPALGTLQRQLQPTQPAPYTVTIANRLWPARGLSLRKPYLEITARDYNAPVEPLDYSDAEAARKTINTWVEQKTNTLIKELIPTGVLSGATRLVLTNAIHFKGVWKTAFDPKRTADAPFTVSADRKVTARLMSHAELSARHAKIAGGQALALPFKGDRLELVVLLPDAVDGLDAMSKQLTPQRLTETLAALQPATVDVKLPRFAFTYEANLVPTFQQLGVKRLFTGNAELGALAAEPLKVDAILHKARVEVYEEGAEAAAATAVVMTEGAIEAPPTPRFHADHPFLFLIRDTTTGAILFMGRLSDPTA